MNKKLFVICPFSNLEPFLQTHFGRDIYFLSASAGMVAPCEVEYLEAIREFIFRERIRQIYLVNDTSCRFMNTVIKKGKRTGLPAERTIEEIYIENYFTAFKNQSITNQQLKLAELSIRNQATEIKTCYALGWQIQQQNLTIKGLVTSKETNLFKEFEIN